MKAYIRIENNRIFAISKIPFPGCLVLDINDDNVNDIFSYPTRYIIQQGSLIVLPEDLPHDEL